MSNDNPYGQDQGQERSEQPAPYPQQGGYGQSPQGDYGQAPQYVQQAPSNSMNPQPNLASWGQRALGYLIDGVIVAIPYFVISAISAVIGGKIGGFLGFVGLLALLVFSGWNRWFLGGQTGQTLGRKQLGTKLISQDTGQPIGPLNAFLRDLVHILDSLACYIGWLFPLWDNQRQTFADKIMKTVVVSERY